MSASDDQHSMFYEGNTYMTEMKEYILCVITVCFLCGAIIQLTSRFKSIANTTRILCGILVAITFFAPVLNLRWNELSGFLDKIKLDAQLTAAEGSEVFYQNRSSGIQDGLQAYILDKASLYGCELQVQIELSEEDPPIPIKVTLQGAVSPYQRNQLSDIIEKELGIPKEMQIWNEIN